MVEMKDPIEGRSWMKYRQDHTAQNGLRIRAKPNHRAKSSDIPVKIMGVKTRNTRPSVP